MKLQHSRASLTKRIAVTAAIIALVSVGWLYYAHHFQKWPFLPPHAATSPTENTINYNKPTNAQTSTGSSIKQQIANQAKDNSGSSTSTGASSSTSPTPAVTIEITSANKTTSTLSLRALIQKVTSTGSCTLTMQGPNSASYTQTVGVQALASASTCQGFDVPLSSLSSGQWHVTITFSDGTDTATVTKDLSI